MQSDQLRKKNITFVTCLLSMLIIASCGDTTSSRDSDHSNNRDEAMFMAGEFDVTVSETGCQYTKSCKVYRRCITRSNVPGEFSENSTSPSQLFSTVFGDLEENRIVGV